MVSDFEVVEAIEDVMDCNGYCPGDEIVSDLVEAIACFVMYGESGRFSAYWESRDIDGTPAIGIVRRLEDIANRRKLPAPWTLSGSRQSRRSYMED